MGIFDDLQPHTISVILNPATSLDGSNSPEYTPSPPVAVQGQLLPVSTKQALELGLAVTNTFQFTTTNDYPGGPVSHVQHGARRFRQYGSPMTHSMGWDIDSTQVILTEIGPEVH